MCRALAPQEPRLYLQFVGLNSLPSRKVSGRDLVEIKKKALDNLAEAGIYAILVSTVVRGVNDDELGDILRFGIKHPAVLGVC